MVSRRGPELCQQGDRFVPRGDVRFGVANPRCWDCTRAGSTGRGRGNLPVSLSYNLLLTTSQAYFTLSEADETYFLPLNLCTNPTFKGRLPQPFAKQCNPGANSPAGKGFRSDRKVEPHTDRGVVGWVQRRRSATQH